MASDASTFDATALTPEEAFDRLAKIVLAEHSLKTVMALIADLARQTLPGAADVSVTLVMDGTPATIATTGPLAQQLDELHGDDHRSILASWVAPRGGTRVSGKRRSWTGRSGAPPASSPTGVRCC